MFPKLGTRFLWFSKPAPPRRPPYTPNSKEFILIILAVIVGIAFQAFAPVIISKIKKLWKFGLNNLCNDRGQNFVDFHVSRKIATESYNTKVAKCNYKKGNEDNQMRESSSKSHLRRPRSKIPLNCVQSK
ncbi:uncharacterized protein LOC119649450 [Hermetia illucens]|uniref:uncharacterized protein LOC119649450 n=1 Tax=Hermetia illucens TaxID=343691 RepID=UPI0018CC6C39|nr:uncharacterized protein LOC119649450 [Hermetia illucens]